MKTLNELLEGYQSVVLGTIGKNGYPFGSYAPCYYDGEKVFVFLSNISTHAQNIQAHLKASALFVEDEQESKNIFARKRISLQCDVSIIRRDEVLFSQILSKFEEKFEGTMFDMIKGMPDFNMYALTPIYGEATLGFAKAFTIGGEKMNELIPRGKGSR